MSCPTPRNLAPCHLASGGLVALALLSTACHRVSSSLGGGGGAAGNLEVGAVFQDVDRDGAVGPGDTITVYLPGLPEDVTAEQVLADLRLPVLRDSFGQDPTAVLDDGKLVISLGVGARLKTRQLFSPTQLADNSPSGIEYDGAFQLSADLVPGLVSSALDLGGGAKRVAILDYDRDGRADLVTANEVRLAVHRGTAAGFAAPEEFPFPASGSANGLVVADLDRDGRDDVLQLTGAGLRVWLRGEAGLVAGDTLYGNDVRDAAVYDANLDGTLDVAIADVGADSLLIGDGLGGFTPAGAGTTGITHAVVAVDVDGDGDVDLVKARTLEGEEELLLLERDGADFTEQVLLSGVAVRHLAAGHLDRDGRLDLALGLGEEDRALRVLYGTGAGTFEERQHQNSLLLSTAELGSAPARALALADLDSDGLADVLVGRDDGVQVFMNVGSFLRECPGLGAGEASDLALADLDRDGDLDVVSVSAAGAALHTGSLSGSWGRVRFQASQALGTMRTHSLACGDVDSDGLAELWTGNNFALERWARPDAGSAWERVQLIDLPSTRVQDLELFDIDRDGDLDVLAALEAAGAGASGLWLALQDEDGEFVPSPLAGYVTPASSLALADFDRDGDVDVALAGMNGAPDQLILNLGHDGGQWLGFDEPFGLGGKGGLPIHTSDVRFADVDGDGDQDLLTAHIPGQPNLLWINDGGIFSPLELPDSVDLNTRAIAVGDLDLDGDLDLVTGNAVGDRIWLREGEQYVLFPTDFVNSDTYEIALARVDGDAFLDLIVANRGVENQEGVQVWFNQGLSEEVAEGLGTAWQGFDDGDGLPDFVLKRGAVGSVLAHDVDGDGDVDIVSGSVSEEVENSLWSNL